MPLAKGRSENSTSGIMSSLCQNQLRDRETVNHKESAIRLTQPHTHLFTVRLWRAAGEAKGLAIRGKVQHVLSGEVEYFGDRKALAAFCAAQMDIAEDHPTGDQNDND